MREAWSVPGYDVQALLARGPVDEVWRARRLVGGETVVLRRLCGSGPGAVEDLRRAAARLEALDTPYVVRVREVVACGTDAVLVLEHAGGGSLATLLARRRVLDPGEVVTVAAPLAQALAAAHARGLVHGHLTASRVLFAGDGMPLLSGLGLGEPDLADPALDGGPAADVLALAGLCHRMLTGAAEGAGRPGGALAHRATPLLAQTVEAALAEDPALRPSAAELAVQLRRAHVARPVRLAPVGPPADRAVVVRRLPLGTGAGRRPRRSPAVAAVTGLLLAGAAAGWVSGRSGAAQAPPVLPRPGAGPFAAALSPSAAAWERVLEGLDAARGRAFAAGDVAALQAVYAPGSRGLASDAALLRSLVQRQQTAHGLRHDLLAVQVLAETEGAVRLRVVDRLAPYEVRDAGGTVLGRGGRRGEQAFVVDLTRTAAGWRLVQVRPTR